MSWLIAAFVIFLCYLVFGAVIVLMWLALAPERPKEDYEANPSPESGITREDVPPSGKR